MTDLEKRVAELEDTLKQRDKQIAELRKDRDADGSVIAALRDHALDYRETIERWTDAFDMKQNDKGGWLVPQAWQRYSALWVEYQALLRRWNAFVPEYNAVVAPRRRNFGRPLQASPKQQDDVRERRKRGESLRAIAEDTALSLQTVRTILNKADGTDRATLARLGRLAPDKLAEAKERRQIRARETLAKGITEFLETNAELVKRAKGQL